MNSSLIGSNLPAFLWGNIEGPLQGKHGLPDEKIERIAKLSINNNAAALIELMKDKRVPFKYFEEAYTRSWVRKATIAREAFKQGRMDIFDLIVEGVKGSEVRYVDTEFYEDLAYDVQNWNAFEIRRLLNTGVHERPMAFLRLILSYNPVPRGFKKDLFGTLVKLARSEEILLDPSLPLLYLDYPEYFGELVIKYGSTYPPYRRAEILQHLKGDLSWLPEGFEEGLPPITSAQKELYRPDADFSRIKRGINSDNALPEEILEILYLALRKEVGYKARTKGKRYVYRSTIDAVLERKKLSLGPDSEILLFLNRVDPGTEWIERLEKTKKPIEEKS